MINVKVLIYERFRNQLEVFLNSFKKVNVSKDINYEFLIVSVSEKPKEIDGCICEQLQSYNGNYRFSFLKKIDDILNSDADLLLIADDRCFCRNSIDALLINLNSSIVNWQLCGSPVDPMFDVNLLQDDCVPLKSAFVYLDGGFLILNCKTVPKGLAELADDLLPSDVQLYTDRVVLNIACDQKIALNKLFCNGLFNIFYFNYDIVLFDIYRTDSNHTPDTFDESFIFLNEYRDVVTDKNLLKEIKKLMKQTPPEYQLQQIISDRLIQKQYLYNKYDELNINEE